MKFSSKTLTAIAFTFMLMTGVTLAQTEADIEQVGTNMDAEVQQRKGVNNSATIKQGTGDAGVSKSDYKATVRQKGENNEAVIRQNGDTRPEAEIEQIGDNNRAKQTQDLGGSNNHYNIEKAKQEGDDNNVRQGQWHLGASRGAPDKVNTKSVVQQTGSKNTAKTWQWGSGTFYRAEITQNGVNNYAEIGQGGYSKQSDGVKASISQEGNNHNAVIRQ